jgi:hypothetical protein
MVEVVAIGQIEEMELELPCSPLDIEPSVISGLGKPGYGITKGELVLQQFVFPRVG